LISNGIRRIVVVVVEWVGEEDVSGDRSMVAARRRTKGAERGGKGRREEGRGWKGGNEMKCSYCSIGCTSL